MISEVSRDTEVMMLKILICITGINIFFKYIETKLHLE